MKIPKVTIKSSTWIRGTKYLKKRTKISKTYAKMMEFHKEFGGAAKKGDGAWTQPMHLLYIPSTAKDPLLKSPHPSNLVAKNMMRFVNKPNLQTIFVFQLVALNQTLPFIQYIDKYCFIFGLVFSTWWHLARLCTIFNTLRNNTKVPPIWHQTVSNNTCLLRQVSRIPPKWGPRLLHVALLRKPILPLLWARQPNFA